MHLLQIKVCHKINREFDKRTGLFCNFIDYDKAYLKYSNVISFVIHLQC